jgi:hypothetical protein
MHEGGGPSNCNMEIISKVKQTVINNYSRLKSPFRRKKEKKNQVPPIQMAMLSGSIRRVK